MINTISREQLKDMLDAKTPIKIVEALPAQYFREQHLPGAINIPHNEIRNKAAEMLVNKDAFIAVYCANKECKNSELAAKILLQMGHTNVHEYSEGKEHWLEAGFSVESTNDL